MKVFKKWVLNWRIRQTLRLLERIDKAMVDLKMPRWKRRQIWRDFIKSRKKRLQVTHFLGD